MIYKYEVYYNSCFCLSGNPAFDALNGMGFQYDSCFYLSREEDKMEEIDYFNTTLVFIYQQNAQILGTNWLFQYNSCFYLSRSSQN